MNDIELVLEYPALLASKLQAGEIDMALLPVAAIPKIANSRIVSNYGIGADGNVVSVALFSRVPLSEIKKVILDKQSRTSVRLAQLLFQEYWKMDVAYQDAGDHHIDDIHGETAGVIIGDRALRQLGNFEYVHDLSAAWKAHIGLDFVFAAWVANKDLALSFLEEFNAANAEGLKHLPEVIAQNPFPYYDLHTYYTENIKYVLDEPKLAGMNAFLGKIS